MKGLEWRTLLAIVILVLLSILMVSVFIGPIWATGPETEQQIKFRFYCVLWAQKGYRGTWIEMEHEPNVDMDTYCTRALRIDCPAYPNCMGDESDPNWDKCRAACKVAAPK